MANNCYCPNDEQAMNPQEEITRGLERELEKNRRLRTEEANGAGSSCSSPSTKVQTTHLLKLLVACCNKTSPRSKSGFPPPRSSRGLSPSQSGSSDGSMSGGVSGFNFKDMELRNNLAPVGLPNTAPAGPIYGKGSKKNEIAARGTQQRVGGQEGVGRTPNSPMASSVANAGRWRNGVPASTSNGGAPAKAPKKRKRPSKKPATRIVEATVAEFRDTVQMLTGFKEPPAPVVRPQPERPQPERPQPTALHVDENLDSRNPPVRPDSSVTSMISAVHSPLPKVSDRVAEAAFSIHGSSTSGSSSSKSSGLNYCMGYDDQATPHFLEEEQHDYDENSGQRQDDSLCQAVSVNRFTSEPVPHKQHAGSTTAASLIGASVQEAPSLQSDIKRKEGISREPRGLLSNHDSGSGAPILHHFTTVLGFSDQRSAGTYIELPLESDWMEDWADAFVNYQ